MGILGLEKRLGGEKRRRYNVLPVIQVLWRGRPDPYDKQAG